jgi:hypothetical protein
MAVVACDQREDVRNVFGIDFPFNKFVNQSRLYGNSIDAGVPQQTALIERRVLVVVFNLSPRSSDFTVGAIDAHVFEMHGPLDEAKRVCSGIQQREVRFLEFELRRDARLGKALTADRFRPDFL